MKRATVPDAHLEMAYQAECAPRGYIRETIAQAIADAEQRGRLLGQQEAIAAEAAKDSAFVEAVELANGYRLGREHGIREAAAAVASYAAIHRNYTATELRNEILDLLKETEHEAE